MRRSSSRFRRSSRVDGSSSTSTCGFHGEDGGQGQQLAFPAGELIDALVRQGQQAEPVQDCLGVRGAFPGVPDGAPQGEFNVLTAGRHHQLGQGIREDESDVPADGRTA